MMVIMLNILDFLDNTLFHVFLPKKDIGITLFTSNAAVKNTNQKFWFFLSEDPVDLWTLHLLPNNQLITIIYI